MQRRKKTPADSSDQPTPPPLQPAYFDGEPTPGPEAAPKNHGVEGKKSGVVEFQPESEPEPVSSERPRSGSAAPSSKEQPANKEQPEGQSARGGEGQRGRRRRRGRGGRGRVGSGGRQKAVAEAFSPSVARGPEAIPVEEKAVPEAEDGAMEALPQPPKAPATATATQRAPKGVVVLAIGLPGSGKTSWFKRHNVAPLSSDMMRTLLFDDVHEQRFQDLVFSNLRSMLKSRLIARRPMNYVDATNLTPQERHHWIKLAKDHNYEVHAVFFDVPLEVCIERHQRRDRVVPEDVMRRMAAKLKPPSFDEGFAKITVVRVKKKD